MRSGIPHLQFPTGGDTGAWHSQAREEVRPTQCMHMHGRKTREEGSGHATCLSTAGSVSQSLSIAVSSSC